MSDATFNFKIKTNAPEELAEAARAFLKPQEEAAKLDRLIAQIGKSTAELSDITDAELRKQVGAWRQAAQAAKQAQQAQQQAGGGGGRFAAAGAMLGRLGVPSPGAIGRAAIGRMAPGFGVMGAVSSFLTPGGLLSGDPSSENINQLQQSLHNTIAEPMRKLADLAGSISVPLQSALDKIANKFDSFIGHVEDDMKGISEDVQKVREKWTNIEKDLSLTLLGPLTEFQRSAIQDLREYAQDRVARGIDFPEDIRESILKSSAEAAKQTQQAQMTLEILDALYKEGKLSQEEYSRQFVARGLDILSVDRRETSPEFYLAGGSGTL